MDWFLYDNGLRHERVKENILVSVLFPQIFYDDIEINYCIILIEF